MSAVAQPKSAGREAIERLQREMSAMPQVELETEHHFSDGMYARMIKLIPAGTLIVGKAHKKEHFFVLLYGTMRITDGDGAPKEFTGPAVIVSKPGTKRAGLAVTDTACLNVHRTKKKNLDKIEAELVEPDGEALFDSRNKLKVIP
jgi:hypothetical protein